MTTTRWTAAALAGALLFGTGCGRALEKAGEKVSEKVTEKVVERAIEADIGGDVDLDYSSGGMRVRTKDGTFQVGGGELPAAWPRDVRLPGLEITSVMESVQDGQASFMVVGQAPGTAAEFRKTVEASLSGWEKTSDHTLTSEGLETISFQMAKDDRELSVTAAEDDDGIYVNITYTGSV